MVRSSQDDRPFIAAHQRSMWPVPGPKLLEVWWRNSYQPINGENCLTEARTICNSPWTTRIFYAALILWAIVAPRIITGLPRPPLDQIRASETHKSTLPLLSDGALQATSFYEYSSDSEPVLTGEGIVVPDYVDKTSDLEAIESTLVDTENPSVELSEVPQSTGPLQIKGMDEVVPFFLPMQPFAPRRSVFSTSEDIPALGGYVEDFQPPVNPDIPPKFAFYGPQSDELQVDDCQHFDAFLVSPLPSTLAARFVEFAQKEATQADGMPYLHHIHGRPSVESADGEDNPRVVVEGGQATPLWSEDAEDIPVFLMEEGAITLFRLVAPVKNAYDAVASMMLMPIINVDMVYGDGLLLSYRVSCDEGRQVNHDHVDGLHRPVAVLDVVYKSCFSVGGEANDAIPVRAELRFAGCEPVVVMWKVICSNSAYLQDVPLGFHLAIGPATPSADHDDSTVKRSEAKRPWSPRSAPLPMVSDLRALASHEGDLVAAGTPNQRVSALKTSSLVFSPSQDFVEMYAWCRGCAAGKLEMQVPTVAADLEVMFPLLYNFVGSHEEEKQDGQTPGLVASRPSSHIVLKEATPGSEDSMSRLILEFQCKSEGESIVALDFSFHAFRDVQIFFKKQCDAPASASLQDPSCSSGVLSEDGTCCCSAACGTCGGDGCEDREGGLMGCCATHIQSAALSCDVSTPPCVMITKNSKSNQELGNSLALPDEEMPPRFRLLLGPIWLMSVVLLLLKFFFWCAVAVALLVYIFTVYYGLHVLKEPVPVAAAPTITQLFNVIFLLGGHLRHLYWTRGGSIFSRDGFHSYAPFEEKVQGAPGWPPRKENPFRHTIRRRPDDTGASFIRLTSFKERCTNDQRSETIERPRPLEFCDIEAYDSAFSGRDCVNEDNLWGDPQGDLPAEGWDDGGSRILSGVNRPNSAQAE